MNTVTASLALPLAAVACLALCWLAASSSPASQPGEAQAGKMLSHDVYFSLNNNSGADKAKLVAECKKYLSGHPGTVFFAAGVVGAEFDRPVNDRDFDVALHIVFKDKAAHDAYQKHERHVQFIEANKANWKKVRVFDSYVEQ